MKKKVTKKTTTPEFDKENPYVKNYKRVSLIKTLITVLFWIFVVGTTAVLVLFSDGYSISLKEKKITQNGAITINTTPDRATVFIDGKKRGNTPLFLPSVKPGAHKIEIVKDKFTTWTQDIFLVKKRAIEINAVLLKNDGNKKLLSDKNIAKIYLADNADELIFTVENTDGTTTIYHRPFDFFLWDLNKNDTEVYTLPNSASLQISPNGNYTLITSEKDLFNPLDQGDASKKIYYVLENKQNSTPVILSDLNAINDIQHVKWPVASENKLIVETSNQVLSYDVQTRQVVILFGFPADTSPVYTSTKFNNVVYINPSDGLPYVVSLQGTNKDLLVNDKSKVSFIDPVKVTVEAQERFILVQDGEKITYLETQRPISTNQRIQNVLTSYINNNTEGITLGGIAPNGKAIYFRNYDNDLYVYSLKTISNKRLFKDSDNIIKAIPASDIEADQVFKWHPNSSNLFTLPVRKSGIAAIKTFNIENENYQILFKGYIADMNFGISNDGDKVLVLLKEDMGKTLYEVDLLDNGSIRLGLLKR